MKYKLKFLPVLLALTMVSAVVFAQNKGAKPVTQIIFIEDAWKEALKQGAAQNKYIFVDAYATWCGPCKMLKAKTFTDSRVAAFYNKNFINVSIDMEKGMGPQLAREWQMEAYPTLIIFSPKGKPVLGTVGFIQPDELLKFAQQALAKKL
ncbi:thioredoxin [Mucilaginibacter gracilis]|uniref:Thioredoxin n=1 Tax=Mucilaginibacter gracilis TaxID=423350 RepID=A0A495J9W0_9SPHI|nr:thioredoxin family protein [Mucilaginibacter gracilis]RKR85268.1 thioredoxin [Mucilaginibacter gracilis]